MRRLARCGCVPALLGAFDFGFLALAGPRLAPELGVSGAAYPWLFSASSFAYGAAVMPAAALTGRLGAARTLAFGLAGAAAGTAMLATSSSLVVTLAARLVFGLGGALAATAAVALLVGIADEGMRRTAFAWLGGAVALGFAGGALAAGLPGWRAVLAAVCVAGLAGAFVAVRLPRVGGDRSPPPLRGAGLLTAAIVCTAAGIAGADARELWAMPALALAGVLACVAMRRAAGWLPPRRPTFAAGCFAGAATTASGVGGTILIALGLTASDLPGALLGVFGLAVVPGSRLAAGLGSRAGAQVTAGAGLSLQAVGLAAAALALATGLGAAALAVALLVFGTGHVAANAGAAATVADVAGARAPSAAGLLIAAQYVGGGVGPLVATAVATGREAHVGVLAAAAIAVIGTLPIATLHLRASLTASPTPGSGEA